MGRPWMTALLGAVAAAAMAPQASASFTYNVSLSAPIANGVGVVTATGIIVVDKLGGLAVGDITGYSVTFASPNLPPTTLTSGNSLLVLFGDVTLVATASNLLVTLPPTTDPNHGSFGLNPFIGTNTTSFTFQSSDINSNQTFFIANGSVFNPDRGSAPLNNSGGTYVVATAAPEPSSLILLATAAGLGLASRRSQRRGSPAAEPGNGSRNRHNSLGW